MKNFRIITIMLAALVMLGGCKKDKTETPAIPPDPNEKIAAITVSVEAFTPMQNSAIDNMTEITFENGDMIGLTVVSSDGTITHNNITLTYNGTIWNLPSGMELFDEKDVSYMAYYPYDKGMSVVISDSQHKSVQELQKSVLDAFKPKLDQSAYASYVASNLLLGEGVVNTTSTPNLDISLSHGMGMLIVEPLGAGYTAPEGAGWVYHENAAYSAPSQVSVSIKLDGKAYKPYKIPDTDTYRVLLKLYTRIPTIVSAGYETLGMKVNWNNKDGLIMNAGQYIKYEVNPFENQSRVERAAAVGDYLYLANGTNSQNRILPSDMMTDATKPATEADRNRMGIIFWLDPADPTKGRVVSLDEVGNLRWDQNDGETSAGRFTTNARDVSDGLANMVTIQTYISYTQREWERNFPPFAWVHNTKNGGAVTYSSGTTGIWYMPSIGELQHILCAATGNAPETWGYAGSDAESFYPSFNPDDNSALDLSTLNTLIAAAGGKNLELTHFWSSTEYDENNAQGMYFGNGRTRSGEIKTSHYTVRAILAF